MDLLEAAPHLMGMVADAFAKAGLKLNYGESKSELLFQFRGPGANRAKKRLWHDAQGKLQAALDVVRAHEEELADATSGVLAMDAVGSSSDAKAAAESANASAPQVDANHIEQNIQIK